ncbi:FtsB family cell division protein [Candidatus Cardinium hertigii]|uniref:Septum formation initiator family protein n=1 Tax=Candidatus Cardinium hertigii TaxID=247481 RepID=A0A2Z3L8I7_9BACT|nr:septum formation initiator family protein [Candidatus Cardinium hertigii]AWN81737.1 hypothetical protein DK880_00409 [Candidatus Cardinium hertigii]
MQGRDHILRIIGKIRKVLVDFYCVVTFFFIIWMYFLDDQNICAQYNVYKQCKKLEREHIYYTTHIQKIKEETKALLQEEERLEQLAREKYYMKKKQEDLYVIIRD